MTSIIAKVREVFGGISMLFGLIVAFSTPKSRFCAGPNWSVSSLARQTSRRMGIAGTVKAGIRYSDLKASARKTSEPGYLEYAVDFFQINGEKLIITAKRNGVKLAVVRELERENRLRIGDPIWLKWESMNRYFFDPESGANLMAPAK